MLAAKVTSVIMPIAYIPSPPRNLWHLGPVPVRAYAICVVAGIIVGLWVEIGRASCRERV